MSNVSNAMEVADKKVPMDLILGFILFLVLIYIGWATKKYPQEWLESRGVSEFKSEIISDFLMLTIVVGAAMLFAPYMGYF